MNVLRRLLPLAALGALALLPASAHAAAIPGQLLVGFQPSATAAQKSEAHRQAGASLDQQLSALNVELVQVPAGREAATLARYRANAQVRYAEQDVEVQLATADPYFRYQWHLDNTATSVHADSVWSLDADVDAPEAWAAMGTAAQVKVAVLDTGIDQDHPDLAGRIIANKNFTTSNTVDDKYGHGTHVAGIIAAIANNNVGVAGISPNARLLNGKVLGDTGSGSCSGVANGMTWAADQGAQVISMSLGGGACSTELNALTYATGKGALVVAAAGNSATSSTSSAYPAAYADALAVASTDDADLLSSFSNYGSWVDIASPGSSITSTMPNHTNKLGVKNYGTMSGTSMATPLVSGAGALIAASLTDTNGNGRTNDELRARLLSSADQLASLSSIGGGRLNACRLVTGAASC